jgi:hypothetical protein
VVLRGLLVSLDRVSAHCCPIKCPIEGFTIRALEPIAPLDGPLVGPEGEAGVLVAELFGDVDGVVAGSRPQRGVGAPQAVRRYPLTRSRRGFDFFPADLAESRSIGASADGASASVSAP